MSVCTYFKSEAYASVSIEDGFVLDTDKEKGFHGGVGGVGSTPALPHASTISPLQRPGFWLGTAFLEISIFQLMDHWALDLPRQGRGKISWSRQKIPPSPPAISLDRKGLLDAIGVGVSKPEWENLSFG